MRTDRLVRLARDLVALPSVSSGSNRSVIDFVASYLRRFRVDVEIHADGSGTKANLHATIGDRGRPGVVLAGHTDVVPVGNQEWHTDPFDPVVRNGCLYGRGSCDMKGFIAAVLSRVPEIVRHAVVTPIHILLTYDEEIGCGGARALVTRKRPLFPAPPLLCIVGEPTEMSVVNAHKGMRLFRTVVKGHAAHSSSPGQGTSAIAAISRLACHLTDLAAAAARMPVQNGLSFSAQHATVNLGVIQGGTAINIIPDHAELLWEYRYMPGADGTLVWDAFSRYAQTLETSTCEGDSGFPPRIVTTELSALPALSAEDNQPLTENLLALLGHTRARQLDYCTEAGIYQTAIGMPTVVCGPGSVQQAHRADEFVSLEQLTRAGALVDQIVERCKEGAWVF